jgi:hypothetical protein
MDIWAHRICFGYGFMMHWVGVADAVGFYQKSIMIVMHHLMEEYLFSLLSESVMAWLEHSWYAVWPQTVMLAMESIDRAHSHQRFSLVIVKIYHKTRSDDYTGV